MEPYRPSERLEGLTVELEQRRLLTEVDNLNRLRTAGGAHAAETLAGIHANLVPAVKEAAVPHAISTTYQEYRNGEFLWLDQTATDVAASGRAFHFSRAALERVEVEVEEMQSVAALAPGQIKVMLSPKMTRADASREVAEAEHLADDDMIRLHMLDVDEAGHIQGKFMQSLLVRHIPHEAWVAMLRDPNNIFGRAFALEQADSALSIMKLHRELILSEDQLPEGAISLVEAVKPYCDQETRLQLEDQLLLFRDNQELIHQRTENIAARWVDFEVELADSLDAGYTTDTILDFIAELHGQWSSHFTDLLASLTQTDGSVRMTRELAAELERSKQNTLWVRAGVINNNQALIQELGEEAAGRIYSNEILFQQLLNDGWRAAELRELDAATDRQVARANIEVGNGCPGRSRGAFGSEQDESAAASKSKEDCVIKTNCPNCSALNTDGTKRQNKVKVVAVIDSQKTIHCRRCGAYATQKGDSDIGRIARLAAKRQHAAAQMELAPAA